MSVIPKIDSINMADVAPRYVWLDEDDEQVSPVHRSLSAALGFVQGWQTRWDRLVAKYGPPSSDTEHWFEKAYVPMTRSGKPPAKLRRVLVTISVVECDDDERSVSEAVLRMM